MQWANKTVTPYQKLKGLNRRWEKTCEASVAVSWVALSLPGYKFILPVQICSKPDCRLRRYVCPAAADEQRKANTPLCFVGKIVKRPLMMDEFWVWDNTYRKKTQPLKRTWNFLALYLSLMRVCQGLEIFSSEVLVQGITRRTRKHAFYERSPISPSSPILEDAAQEISTCLWKWHTAVNIGFITF